MKQSPFRPSCDLPFDPKAWARQVYQETIRRTERQLAYFRLMAGVYPSYARRAEQLEAELKIARERIGQ